MAKKCDWNGKPAYEEGPLILQLDEEINKWRIYHKQTTFLMVGHDIVGFKQKRDALAFALGLIQRFDMDFDSKEKMEEINGGYNNCVRLRNEAFNEAMNK